jgi:molybdopterin molybdotransferase|tara:strand:- start:3216 stop:4418 length:1203 start_codon:yes stop_codon:yes gene_type:complete
MISSREASQIIFGNQPPLIVKEVLLEESMNCVTSEDIISPESSPSYTNSAMDGFAVKWSDVEPASNGKKVELAVNGESRAGFPFNGEYSKYSAIRISTGAMVPEGTDTVIPVELCAEMNGSVIIKSAKYKGQHIRFSGEEFHKGDLLLEKGKLICPGGMALLASVGIHSVPVYLPPDAAVFVTGSEIVHHENPCEIYQVRDSNSIMLRAALKNSGVKNVSQSLIKDSLDETISALQNVAETRQLVIFSGGVSVGLHDYVKEAAEHTGFKPKFWKVKQKPGKPFYFAKKGNQLLFGLPGNPVSAFMSYIHYIHPLIIKMRGLDFSHTKIRGELSEKVENKGDRTKFIRIKVDKQNGSIPLVSKLKLQGSHMLTSIALADGYLIVKKNTTLKNKSIVEVNIF